MAEAGGIGACIYIYIYSTFKSLLLLASSCPASKRYDLVSANQIVSNVDFKSVHASMIVEGDMQLENSFKSQRIT